MASVHCLDCGSSVVVDPNGICPEGHVVGSAGARIERGMGTASPHPDEPQPWVATVVLDEAEAGPAARQRSARPLRALGSDVEERPTAPVDHDAMLRELHELGAFSGSDDLSALAAPATAPVRPASNTPTPGADHAQVGGREPGADADTAAPAAPLPTRDEVADGFAELSALEAAVQALAPDEPSAAPSADRDRGAASDLSALEDLFGSPAAPQGAAPATPPTASPGPTAPPIVPSPGPVATTPPSAPPAPPAPPAPGSAGPASDAPHDPISADPGTHGPADDDPVAHDPEPPAPPAEAPAAGLDITNFTARGSKVGAGRSGRRKLFGR